MAKKAKSTGTTTYRSFDELNGKTLKQKDIVYLKGTKYTVYQNYLCITGDSRRNDEIFTELGFSGAQKYRLATLAFGRVPNAGSLWPTPEHDKHFDMEALTRLVLVVYTLIEGDATNAALLKFKQPRITVDLEAFYNVVDQNKELAVVGLTDDYKAVLTPSGIRVGCQTISYKKLTELFKAALQENLLDIKYGKWSVEQTHLLSIL